MEKLEDVNVCAKDGACGKDEFCEKANGSSGGSLMSEGGVGCAKDQFCEKINSLHSRFSEYGRNAKEWARKCMLLLPEIDKYKVWAKKGFRDVYEYAAKIAGLNTEQVMEGLRVLKKVKDMPALKEVIEKKGINAVRPVATIATVETAEFWAEKAISMTKNELEMYVRDFRRQGGLGSGANSIAISFDDLSSNGSSVATSSSDDFSKQANRNGSLPRKELEPEKTTKTIVMELDGETAEQLEKAKGQGEWEEAIKKLLALRARELEKNKPESVETESRHIPAEIERYVVERDCGTCAFPGCHRRYEELHHTQGFARESVHDPDRIFCLCEAHHGLAHRGLIENEEMPARWWRVRGEADCEGSRFGLDRLVVGYRRVAGV